MRIEPAALAKSIGTLTTLDPSEGFPEALHGVVASLLRAAAAAPMKGVLARAAAVGASASCPDRAG